MPEQDASTAMSSDANSSVVQPADVWQIRASIVQNEEQRWTHNRRPAELSLNSRAGQPAPASVPARPRTGLPPSVDNEATALGFPSDIVSEGGLREGTNIREMDSTLSRPAEEEVRGYAEDTGWARSFFENTYANGMGPAGPKRAPLPPSHPFWATYPDMPGFDALLPAHGPDDSQAVGGGPLASRGGTGQDSVPSSSAEQPAPWHLAAYPHVAEAESGGSSSETSTEALEQAKDALRQAAGAIQNEQTT